MKKLLVCLLLCMFLCGCYDNISIDRCAHPLAAGYDADENGCTVTGVYYMPTSGEAPETRTISIHAQSPGEARIKRNGYSFEAWSPDLLNTIDIGKSVTQSGVYPFMDMLARAHTLSADILLCAYDGEAADLLTPEEGGSGEELAAMLSGVLQTAGPLNLLPRTNAAEAYAAVLNGRTVLLPIIVRQNELLCTEGSLLLLEGKQVAQLNAEETVSAVMLSNSNSTGLISFVHENVKTTAQCAITCSANAEKCENGSIRFTVEMNVRAAIAEHSSQQPTQLDSAAVLASLREQLYVRTEEFYARTHELGLDATLLQSLAASLGANERDAQMWKSCETVIRVEVSEKEG